MTDHANTRIRARTSYENYLRPRKLIQDAIRVNKFSDVVRRQKARAVSAKILQISKQEPDLIDIEIEDYILTANQAEHEHESLHKNRRRKSLFKKRTVEAPYKAKKSAEHEAAYRSKKPVELKSAKKRISGKTRFRRRRISYKLAFAAVLLMLSGGFSLFWIGPRAARERNEVNAQLFDEDMTVAGIPIDISNEPQVLSKETTVKNPEKAPSVIFLPALNISADISPVGLHANGTLAQTGNKRTVGWYKASSYPDSKGTTLLTAYKDDISPLNGIASLKNGDLIELRDVSGEGFWYRVKSLEFYATRKVPMNELVTVNKGDNLVIVVPNGTWIPDHNYFSERIVIVADSVN